MRACAVCRACPSALPVCCCCARGDHSPPAIENIAAIEPVLGGLGPRCAVTQRSLRRLRCTVGRLRLLRNHPFAPP
jgi:hypothetical protein